MYIGTYEVPEEMELTLQIDFFYFYGEGGKEKVQGSWQFAELAIAQSQKDVQVIELHDSNGAGVGLEAVEVSPVEITLHPIAPDGQLIMAVVLDKYG